MLTINHRVTPKSDRLRSYITSDSIPRMAIAESTNALATHFKYQSNVYLGVADLKIRLEFFNSFGSNHCIPEVRIQRE